MTGDAAGRADVRRPGSGAIAGTGSWAMAVDAQRGGQAATDESVTGPRRCGRRNKSTGWSESTRWIIVAPIVRICATILPCRIQS